MELDLGLLVLKKRLRLTDFCKRDGWWIYLTGGGYGSLCLTHVGERSVFGLLMYVVHRLRVFLLVVDEGAAVRTGPAGNKIMCFNISPHVLGLTCTYHICKDVLRCDVACD